MGYDALKRKPHESNDASGLAPLSDKVHELGALVALGSGMTVGMDLLKQEGHIRYQRPHGLHALGVELHLALAGSVGDVPVL